MDTGTVLWAFVIAGVVASIVIWFWPKKKAEFKEVYANTLDSPPDVNYKGR